MKLLPFHVVVASISLGVALAPALPVQALDFSSERISARPGAAPHALGRLHQKTQEKRQEKKQAKTQGQGQGPAKPASAASAGQERGAGGYTFNGVSYRPKSGGFRQRGVASWYGRPFHGRRTANGEIYNMHGNTAAHRGVPLGTVLLVRNLDNGRSAVVRVNDRIGTHRRVIDLSLAKAQELNFVNKGLARVELVQLEPTHGQNPKPRKR